MLFRSAEALIARYRRRFAEAGLPVARARGAAQAFLAALEGALLLARAGVPGAGEAPGSAPGDGVVLGVATTMLDALL